MLWRVIKTAPFQRLRRIRQLGLSEFVYPGATHTRFSHSLGVFSTARELMKIVRRFVPDQPGERLKAEAALAAALLHDVGHGPFSHAFEPVGQEFDWKLVRNHENHSEALIKSTEDGAIGQILNGYSEGFAETVAGVVRGGPASVYRSVVSSQFDADRLDYVRRDRLMTGTHLAGIDFDWLMANLEIGELDVNGIVRKTFVLGPKAIYAAEGFVIGLFQMYPTVYFHKTTRGAEKLLQFLLKSIAHEVLNGNVEGTGLPVNHALVKVIRQPDSLSALRNLDDFSIIGSLPMLVESKIKLISDFSRRLQTRNFFKAIDLNSSILNGIIEDGVVNEGEYIKRQRGVTIMLDEWKSRSSENAGRILIDKTDRKPYKTIEDEGPMNQIWIREGSNLIDLREKSSAVRAISTFRIFKAYVAEDDREAKLIVNGIVSSVTKGDL
jgi:uncharacterized protein